MRRCRRHWHDRFLVFLAGAKTKTGRVKKEVCARLRVSLCFCATARSSARSAHSACMPRAGASSFAVFWSFMAPLGMCILNFNRDSAQPRYFLRSVWHGPVCMAWCWFVCCYFWQIWQSSELPPSVLFVEVLCVGQVFVFVRDLWGHSKQSRHGFAMLVSTRPRDQKQPSCQPNRDMPEHTWP